MSGQELQPPEALRPDAPASDPISPGGSITAGVRPGVAVRLDEPSLVLPTWSMLLVGVAAPAAVGGLWALAGLLLDRPSWQVVGFVAAFVVSASAVLSTLATVPWIPKPASTAGLAWMAGSALRGLLSIAGGFLLYSAPPFGWSEDLAKGATPFLLSVATAWFVALLAEVVVIARHVLRATATPSPREGVPSDSSGAGAGDSSGRTAPRR